MRRNATNGMRILDASPHGGESPVPHCIGVRRVMSALLLFCLFAASTGASAQVQRSFINLGFEQPAMGANCNAQVPASTVPGWQTTHPSAPGYGCGALPAQTGPLVELWSTGYDNVTARAGTQFAELNAQQASRIYQDICLINGEAVSWRFSHRGRQKDQLPVGDDVAEFNVNSTANTIFTARTDSLGDTGVTAADCVANEGGVTSGTCNAPSGLFWQDYSGRFVWNGGSGVQNFGFGAISSVAGVSYGNFLDDVNITLRPFVEFAAASINQPESGTSVVQIRVVGEVTAAFVVPITVAAGTATTTTDFTVGNVTVPAGDYGAGTLVTVPLTIVNDAVIEDNETLALSIAPSNAGSAYVLASTSTCGGTSIGTVMVTIVDNDVDLRTTKTTSTTTPAPGVPFTFTVIFSNNTARTTVAPLTAHDAFVSLSDAVPAGLTFTSWTCTASGGATCPSSQPFTPGTSGSGAISFSSAALPAGTSGGAGGTLTYVITATASSSPTCTSVTNTSTIAVSSGYQEGTSVQSGFTSPAPGGTANNTATATITPCTATLRLQKELSGGRVLAGDQFSLSMTGTGAPAAVVTTGSGSTVSSAALTHTSAVPGTAYTLSEAASGTTVLSNYTSTYSCTNARAGGQTPGGNGASFSVTPVGGDDLTCTFRNIPTTTLTLQKTWSGAQLNNAVTVSVTNPAGVGTALNAVANTAGETDAGTAFPVARGTTYTLTENFTTGAATNYTKTLTCTGNTGTGAATTYTADALSGTVTIGSTATSVVCTFGNSWLPTTIRLQKQLTNGRVQAGDQFSLSMSGSGAPAAVVTTGTGSTVSSTALTHAGAVPGSAYTLSEAASGTTVLSNYTATYACTNTRAGGQAPSGSGTSFSVTPVAGDDLTCTFSNAAPVMTSFGTCDGRLYRSQGSPSATSLYSLGTGANPLATTLIGPASQSPYDAIGYHPTDHFLYGIAAGNSNALVRIDSNGTQVNLGPITDLPILPGGQNYIVGEIGSDGFLYVMHGASSTNLYRINLTTRVATLRTLSTAVAFGDFAWVGGNLYAIDPAARQLLRIDPAGGAVTVVGPTNIASASQTGAMYGGPTNLYGIYETGGLYKFDLTTGAGTPIANVAGAASTDGAHCATVDVSFTADLGITKTDGAAGYTPGSNSVYTIVVSNNGSFGAQGARVQDALPSGITTANWTCTAANGAVCRTASGSGAIDAYADLPFNTTGAGATATYTLTMTVPSGFTGNLVNTATVTAGAGTTDSNSANNSATDTDTPAVADLSIQKTATPNPVVSGEQVVFTLVVTNNGPAPADGATVRDPAVAGLDCLEAGLPAPTCSATGGATCPSPLTVAALQAGAVIPVLPNGGVVTLGMTCRATASGLP